MSFLNDELPFFNQENEESQEDRKNTKEFFEKIEEKALEP